MPRTKQHRKGGKRQSIGCEQLIRDFNKLVQLRIHNMEEELKNMEKRFYTAIHCTSSRYPLEIQNMTLKELLTVDPSPVKETPAPRTPKVSRTIKKASVKLQKVLSAKRVTATSDDGYQSESAVSQASKATTRAKQRSRSTSRDAAKERTRSISRDRKLKVNVTSTQKKKKDLLRTPTTKTTTNDFVITPKIKLNSAMNVLRKPKDGEMVFSTQGSPLLVSTTVSDKTANINVPLKDGNIVSLLPFHDTSLTDNLFLDDETKHQLKILHSHLSKVLY